MIIVELVRDAVTSPTNRNNRRSRLGQLYATWPLQKMQLHNADEFQFISVICQLNISIKK